MNALGRALQLFRPDAHRLAVVAFLLLGSIGATLLKPWPLAVLIDAGLGDHPPPVWLRSMVADGQKGAMIGILAVCVLLLHLAQGGLAAAQHHMPMQIGLDGVRRARELAFGCLLRLSMRFLQGARSGELARRATVDTCSFHVLLHDGLVATAGAGLSIGLIFIVLWQVSAVLTLVTLMMVPMLLAVMKHFGGPMAERSKMAQQAESSVSSFIQQSIVMLPLTWNSGREDHETSAFGSRTMVAMQKREAQLGWELGYWLVVSVVFAAGTAGLVWLGVKQVAAGKITVGEWLVFLAYLPMLHEPLRQLFQAGGILRESVAGTGRVFEMLDTADEVRELPNARPAAARPTAIAAQSIGSDNAEHPAPTAEPASSSATDRIAGVGAKESGVTPAVQVAGNIEFDRVSFEFQGEPILRDVSIRVDAGRSMAIVGLDGAGRAALMNLLPRFYDPTSGSVRLEGVDVRELRLRDLRAQVAVVSPEAILLPASIAENIAYARPRARSGEVEAAARAAHADDFIRKLPNGYLTMVGEGGTRLSPGERHRLELARAFLKNPPIVLIDEPTAEFDPESEELAQASLRDLMAGRTTVIAAHRMATARLADGMLVLRDGILSPADGVGEPRSRDVQESRK